MLFSERHQLTFLGPSWFMKGATGSVLPWAWAGNMLSCWQCGLTFKIARNSSNKLLGFLNHWCLFPTVWRTKGKLTGMAYQVTEHEIVFSILVDYQLFWRTLCWVFLTLCMCRPSTHLHIIERTLAQSLPWYILILLGLADLCNCHFEPLTLWRLFKDTWHSMRYFQGRQ